MQANANQCKPMQAIRTLHISYEPPSTTAALVVHPCLPPQLQVCEVRVDMVFKAFLFLFAFALFLTASKAAWRNIKRTWSMHPERFGAVLSSKKQITQKLNLPNFLPGRTLPKFHGKLSRCQVLAILFHVQLVFDQRRTFTQRLRTIYERLGSISPLPCSSVLMHSTKRSVFRVGCSECCEVQMYRLCYAVQLQRATSSPSPNAQAMLCNGAGKSDK